MFESQLLCVLGIIFFGTLFGSTFGFGLGLVSMPLLALIVDMKTATPLLALVLLLMALMIFIGNRKEVNFRSMWKLLLGSLIGIPIGVYFLKGTEDSIMKIMLAGMIILFALYSLFTRVDYYMKAEWPSYIMGILAGGFGAAYNMGGPPVIIYGTLKKWPPSTFRSTLYSFFLPTSILAILSHFMAGLVSKTVISYFLLSIPIVVFSTIVGGKLNRKISAEKFHSLIHICLLFIGCFLLYREFS